MKRKVKHEWLVSYQYQTKDGFGFGHQVLINDMPMINNYRLKMIRDWLKNELKDVAPKGVIINNIVKLR